MKDKKQGPQKTGPAKVYLIGAGPGDPALITVRGRSLLQRAEVVIYDYLASKKLLRHVPEDAEFIYAGKRGGMVHSHTQEEINRMLVDRALSGRTVVRLKGGDPFIFGRGGEEIEELIKAGIPFEVVPGVTSATAAATYAGVPITHRQYTSTVAFITGHEDPTKSESRIAWDKIATGIGTLVIFMGIKNIARIVDELLLNGRDPKSPVAVVRWASTPEQRSVVGTLENIVDLVHESGIKPPALIVVGDVVKLRDKLNWFEKRPLFGKRILITRAREQAAELVELLEEEGADCLAWATISIEPPETWDELDRALDDIAHYQWILFTSKNAVKYFFTRLLARGMDARDLKGPRIGVVGTSTADFLKEYGLRADLLPEQFTGEGLAASLTALGVEGARILIPRALRAREVLPESLQAAGAEVTKVPVYRNVRPEGNEELLRKEFTDGKIDLVVFTSSSTVRNFLEMLNAADQGELQGLMRGVRVAVIGPVTAKTARRKGLRVDIQPRKYTIPALVDAIQHSYGQKAD